MSPGGKNGSVPRHTPHKSVHIGRRKIFQKHRQSFGWTGVTWVLLFVVFVSSFPAEPPPASLPSRVLSPKALTSFIRYTKEFNAKVTRCIATTTFVSQTHEKIAALRLVGDACRCTHYVIWYSTTTALLLVVVHDINVKKQGYRKARLTLVPYQGRKTIGRRCAEDSL